MSNNVMGFLDNVMDIGLMHETDTGIKFDYLATEVTFCMLLKRYLYNINRVTSLVGSNLG